MPYGVQVEMLKKELKKGKQKTKTKEKSCKQDGDLLASHAGVFRELVFRFSSRTPPHPRTTLLSQA